MPGERSTQNPVEGRPEIIRILYLDDEEGLLEIGKLFLEMEGDFSVSTTTSPEEALDLIEAHRCDAVLSDYQMPRMNGIEFLKRVRALDENIPFIIFTGRGREEVVIEALNSGADFYLQKGGDPTAQFTELKNALRTLVERSATEQRLHRTESMLFTMAKHVRDVIFRISTQPALGVEYISPAIVSITGHEQNDFYDDPTLIMRLVHPDDRFLMERWAAGEMIAGDHTLRWTTKDGRTIWIEQSNVPIRDHRGRAIAFEGIARDVTRRMENESELRHNVELYRLMADNTTDLVWISDLEHRITYSSPSLTRIFPKEGKGSTGKMNELMSAHTSDKYHSIIFELLSLSWGLPMDQLQRREMDGDLGSKGLHRTYNIKFTLLRQEDGHPKGVLCVGRDVTERLEAIDRAQKEEQFLQKILSSIQDGITVMDLDRRILMVNPTLNKWYPDCGEIVGKKCHEVFHLRDEPCDDCPVEDALRTGDSNCHNVPRRNIEGGVVGWLELHSFPFYSESGELTGRIEYLRDISEQLRTEEALHQAKEKIEILDTITRHDIMNQLTIMKGNMQLMRVTNKEFAKSRYVEAMQRSVENIERQVRFAKDYQNLGQNGMVWQSAEDVFRRSLGSQSVNDIKIFTNLRGLFIKTDRMVERVFYNLIDNTLEHGGDVTRIKLEMEPRPDGLALIYSDDGKGVPEERKDNIFQIVHGERSGLGLFLCRSILEMSNIKIVENGEPGKGARFEMLVAPGFYQISC
jgi:PAS domain S-box-containing protein